MRIAYDGSSYLWRALLAGKDLENGYEVDFEGKKTWVNSAAYGYDIAVDLIISVLVYYKAAPKDMILVWEGVNSKSKRLLISPDYKATRGSRPPEAYAEFEKLKMLLSDTFLGLGAHTVTQPYAEADDTLAWLAQESESDLIIATYDNDLAALNGVNSFGAEIETWIDGLRGVNKYGNFDHKLITSYKALVGDTSDNIKGCPGFGPAAFEKFCTEFGYDGLEEFQGLCEAGSLDVLHSIDHKLVKKIVAAEVDVLKSYELAKLRPEWVNTFKHPVEIKAGMTTPLTSEVDSRLKHWYGVSRVISKDNYDQAVAWMAQELARSTSVALDIETTTLPESDEWLERQGKPDGVDVFGSTLTGLGITFGSNNQYSFYFSVNHTETNNLDTLQVLEVVKKITCPIVVHNSSFELSVLAQEWAGHTPAHWVEGFIPNIRDTLLEASYVNENTGLGLKARSLLHLGYTQVEYDAVTTLSGMVGKLPKGGKLLRTWAEDEIDFESRKYKMHELSSQHVKSYGLDDTICTAALHNHSKLVMELEHTYKVYKVVELPAAYLHAQMFLTGVDVSLGTLRELTKEDNETYDAAWGKLRSYLIAQGWEGTVCPTYTADITPAQVKEAFSIVTGRKLDTMVRTISKLVTFTREVENELLFSSALQLCLAGDAGMLNRYVADNFSGEPESPVGSPKKMAKLMYEVLELPVKVTNKVTDAARDRGETVGTPKTDALAIAYAMQGCSPEVKEVLESLKLMQMVQTRRSLYYDTYPNFIHWKDGKVHSSHRQCSTNTRRASSSSPNLQQLPKQQKIDGQAAKFRSVLVPHRKDAVIVSMDFSAQELRLIADYSNDSNMVACYVGDNLVDMHTLTALGIIQKQEKPEATYEWLKAALANPEHPFHSKAKAYRSKGKAVNFSGQYGVAAPKLANMLMVSEAEAQMFLDAKEAAFPGVEEWKTAVTKSAKTGGKVLTKLGGVRHLRDALMSNDKWEASKAERQAVNFKIQGSSAEQTKLAEGRMWEQGLFTRFDARFISPIHDETVASVLISDLHEFLPLMHTCMVGAYADLVIPVESSISFGWDFYNQIEIGSEPTREAIEEGIRKLKEKL